MGDPADDIPPEWRTADGEIINPGAPAGGGGSGHFRQPASRGMHLSFNFLLPQLDSPCFRFGLPPKLPVPPKPPPATVPTSAVLKSLHDQRNDIEVKIQVVADAKDPSITLPGETGLVPPGARFVPPKILPHRKVPGRTDDAVDTVAAELTKFVFTGSLTIQTRYKPGVDPADPSGYGRGTTDVDKLFGDVSLGFHESRHREDLLGWFKTHPLPVYAGKVGMTVKEYKQAGVRFQSALDAYVADALAFSKARTDEVGAPKLSEYLRAQQSPSTP